MPAAARLRTTRCRAILSASPTPPLVRQMAPSSEATMRAVRVNGGGLTLRRALNLGGDELGLTGELLYGHRHVLVQIHPLERLYVLRGRIQHHQLDRGHELPPSW